MTKRSSVIDLTNSDTNDVSDIGNPTTRKRKEPSRNSSISEKINCFRMEYRHCENTKNGLDNYLSSEGDPYKRQKAMDSRTTLVDQMEELQVKIAVEESLLSQSSPARTSPESHSTARRPFVIDDIDHVQRESTPQYQQQHFPSRTPRPGPSFPIFYSGSSSNSRSNNSNNSNSNNSNKRLTLSAATSSTSLALNRTRNTMNTSRINLSEQNHPWSRCDKGTTAKLSFDSIPHQPTRSHECNIIRS
ncbi:unnamed protein product [Absidia cylindrospora]